MQILNGVKENNVLLLTFNASSRKVRGIKGYRIDLQDKINALVSRHTS